MTDDRTCEETSKIDPVIPREMWRSAVWEFFLRSAEEDSEVYNLPAIEREDSEIFEQIAEQVLILEQLGDARQSETERSLRTAKFNTKSMCFFQCDFSDGFYEA
jgi:hypothetical protein